MPLMTVPTLLVMVPGSSALRTLLYFDAGDRDDARRGGHGGGSVSGPHADRSGVDLHPRRSTCNSGARPQDPQERELTGVPAAGNGAEYQDGLRDPPTRGQSETSP